MARSILVLILAAAPALAQYNANTYNVRPSGGSVGQVCFYETAANGSNKVCLSAAASLSGDVTFKWPTGDGSAGQALVTDGAGQWSWSSVGSPPFSDAAPIIKDNTDATKELLFDVSGFTTATQRTVTVPNASFIMAGRNVDNAFSALQSFTASIDAAPSGSSGDYIKTRALRIYQDTSTSVHWFFETPSSNTFRLKANDAKPALTFDTSTSPGYMILADNTATSGIAYHFIPGSTSGVQDLGASSTPWRTAYLKTSLIHNGTTRIDSSGNGNFASLQIGGGTIINSSSRWGADLMPSVDNTHALGGPSLRWNSAHIENLTVASCTGCGSSSLPVADTTSIVEGSADATKEVRIEADGITTGTVRVWTAPNANITVAGIDLAQAWTAAQTFNSAVDVNASLSTRDITTDSGYDLSAEDVYARTRLDYGVELTQGGAQVLNSARRWSSTTGALSPSSNNLQDLGESSSFQWRTIRIGTSLIHNGTTRIDSSGNGAFVGLTASAASTFSSTVTFNSAVDINASLSTRDITTDGGYDLSAEDVFARTRLDYGTEFSQGGATVLNGSIQWVHTSLSPSVNNTKPLGGSSNQWSILYLGTSLIHNGTTRVDSSGNGMLASLGINGTSNVIDSSRNASFVSLTINGTSAISSSRNTDFANLKFTGQPWWPVTDDNSWTPSGTTTAKLYVYDSSGVGIGWIPIYP